MVGRKGSRSPRPEHLGSLFPRWGKNRDLWSGSLGSLLHMEGVTRYQRREGLDEAHVVLGGWTHRWYLERAHPLFRVPPGWSLDVPLISPDAGSHFHVCPSICWHSILRWDMGALGQAPPCQGPGNSREPGQHFHTGSGSRAYLPCPGAASICAHVCPCLAMASSHPRQPPSWVHGVFETCVSSPLARPFLAHCLSQSSGTGQ